MSKRKHTDDIIIFIILAIGVSIVAFIAFGRYSDNKDISSNTAQQVSGKVEENKPELPKTGVIAIGVVVALMLISAAGIVFITKKNRK